MADILFCRMMSQLYLMFSIDCAFKFTKKLDRDTSGTLNKFKTPSHCGFPLANPQSKAMLDFVPESNPVN